MGEEVQEIRTIEKNPRPAIGNTDHLHLKFDEIRVATNDFSRELGNTPRYSENITTP
ncbi:hypothetical protein OROHE_012506 [Orobanche hederae]